MSRERGARIEKIVIGVLRQAFTDAGAKEFTLLGAGQDAHYVASLCERAGGTVGSGLVVHSASKTALLLGCAPAADVLPLGDLYATQVVALAGPVELPREIEELAAACGGAETLDRALQRYFDERRGWDAATAGLPGEAAAQLKERLEAARFRRIRIGLVPKLGARTPGIDLYA